MTKLCPNCSTMNGMGTRHAILQSATRKTGLTDEILVPYDRYGDGKADIAIGQPSNGIWFMRRSTSGLLATQFGQVGDKPIPAAYIPVQ